MKFTREQKIQALRREIALRRNVFARRVDLGKMTQEQADYEVAIMEEILEEYTFCLPCSGRLFRRCPLRWFRWGLCASSPLKT